MNQVEVKRKQIQFLAYALAVINVWVFGRKLGNNGLAYLTAALLVFAFFWIFTGKNIPDRMGKLLRGRSAKGQYKNVSKMRRNMMLFQMAAGLLAALFCTAVGYTVLEKVFRVPYGSMILWILCPALFFRCIQSVFLGCFQGEGSEMPSAVSCVLRQVFYLGLGLLFLGIFGNYGEKVSLLLKRDDFTAMYGAMGVALGILISELLVTLFLFVIYRGSMSGRRENENGMKGTDSFAGQIGSLFPGIGGDILRQLLFLLPLWLGLILFQRQSQDIYASAEQYGVFAGRYLVTLLFPTSILYAGMLSCIARTCAHLKKKEDRFAKSVFQAGMQGVFLHGMFFTIVTAVLALPIAQTLDNTVSTQLADMFAKGSSIILWLLLLLYCSEILKMTGKGYLVLAGYGIMDIVFVIAETVLLNLENAGSLSIVLGSVISMACGAVFLCVIVCLQMKTWPDALRSLAIPVGCSLACGLLAFGLEKILLPHLGAVVTILLELVITLLLYWFLLIMLRCFKGSDFSYIPCGRLMRKLGKILRLI